MADKEKKVARKSDVEKATTDESKAAEKVAKAAKGNTNKKDKPNFFVRSGKGAKRFYKDFKGECKKIVWPDAKTVLKSTGIVILVVAIVGLIVYGIDQGLSAGVAKLESFAVTETTAAEGETTTAAGETTTKADDTTKADESTTKADESTTAESTTEAESKAEDTTAAETDE